MIKYRPWLLSAAAVSAALILCVCLHNEISWILTAAGITLAAVFLFIFRKEDRFRIALCLLAVLCCIGSFAFRYRNSYRYALQYAGKTSEVTAYVHAVEENAAIVRLISVNREAVEKKVDLYLKTDEVLEIGNTVRFYADITRYDEYVYTTWSASVLNGGVYLSAELDRYSKLMYLADTKPDPAMRLQLARDRLAEAADTHLSADAAAIYQGMLLAERRDMDEILDLDFRYSGFAHLLAVSGLHIQIIASMLSAILGVLLHFSRHRKVISKVLTLFMIWGYILLIGMPISAIRSGIMVTVCIVGYLLQKRSDLLNSLGLSVVLILWTDPFAIGSLGLWMSVCAVFGIGVLCPMLGKLSAPLRERIFTAVHGKYKKQKLFLLRKAFGLFDGLTAGMAASVGLLPVYLFVFSYLPVGAVLIGGVLGILFAAILLFGILFAVSGLIGLVPGLSLCAVFLEVLLGWLKTVISFVAAKPVFCIPLRWEFAVIFTVFFLLGLLLCSRKIRKKLLHTEKRFGVGIFLASFFLLGLLFTQYYQYNIIEITAVGGYENKNVAVITENKATVFICYDTAVDGKEMLQFLKKRGVREIDRIFLMRPGNGAPDAVLMLERYYPVGELYYNGYGLPADRLMTPIETGDIPLSGGMVASFAYSKQGLNVALERGAYEVYLMQDLSLLGVHDTFLDNPNVLMVYAPIKNGAVGYTETELAVLLEDGRLPGQIKAGQTVLFSDEAVVLRIDRFGMTEDMAE